MSEAVIAALIGLGGLIGVAIFGFSLKFALKMTGSLERVETKVDGLQDIFNRRIETVDDWMKRIDDYVHRRPQSQEADD